MRVLRCYCPSKATLIFSVFNCLSGKWLRLRGLFSYQDLKSQRCLMSGLMCLARELEMMLLNHIIFHSLFVSHHMPSDVTLENVRVNTTWGFFFSEHEEIFSPVVQFPPCVSQLTFLERMEHRRGFCDTPKLAATKNMSSLNFSFIPKCSNCLKTVQGAKPAENYSFFCAMSALSLLAMGSNYCHAHGKNRVENMAMGKQNFPLHLL